MSGTRLFSIIASGGGSVDPYAISGRTQSASMAATSSGFTVVFTTPMANSNYTVLTSISNLTDTDPIFIQVVTTQKTTTGFTVLFNAPTDSANYILEYLVAVPT